MTFSTRKDCLSPLRFLQEKDIMHRFNMILIAALATGQAALWSQTPSHSADTAKISPNLVSFYEVPLACPAARGLGCGSAAKPVLQALEKKSGIQEAWLDHPGTTLVIVWKKDARPDSRSAEIQSVADDRGIALREITGERRDDTLGRRVTAAPMPIKRRCRPLMAFGPTINLVNGREAHLSGAIADMYPPPINTRPWGGARFSGATFTLRPWAESVVAIRDQQWVIDS
jgi:hypothetical protein